jgi:hypothetical protein
VSTLAVAIERKQWELVSLCLLVGVVEAAAALPPESVEGLLEVLAQTGQPVGLAGLEGEDVRPRGGARSPSTELRAGSDRRRRDPFDKLPGRAGRTGRDRRG